jgi:hypothetical protein
LPGRIIIYELIEKKSFSVVLLLLRVALYYLISNCYTEIHKEDTEKHREFELANNFIFSQILRPKSKVKQCRQPAFSKLNEIPACAGMTQTAWKKQKAARHAIGFLLSWNDDCRAAFSVQPGRFVIPA